MVRSSFSMFEWIWSSLITVKQLLRVFWALDLCEKSMMLSPKITAMEVFIFHELVYSTMTLKKYERLSSYASSQTKSLINLLRRSSCSFCYPFVIINRRIGDLNLGAAIHEYSFQRTVIRRISLYCNLTYFFSWSD